MNRKNILMLLLAAMLCILPLSSLAEVNTVSSTPICLACGSETEGELCPFCGRVRGVWTCFHCGADNLSNICRVCDKSRNDSLLEQAFCGDPLRAWPAVRKLAEDGDGEALCLLAEYYKKGLYVAKDPDAVIDCYRRACSAGYNQACLLLGKLYDEGDVVPQDKFTAAEYFQQAAELYIQAAEAGDADSWMSVAACYAEGKGTKQNASTALSYYEMAAEAGSANACDYLGYLYMAGEEVEKDEEKAVEYYKKAAELGNARSMMALGYACLTGQGLESDVDQAVQWFELAALNGRTDALEVFESLR